MSSESDNIPSDLLDAILNDPNKRQIVLKLLNKTKSTKNDNSSKKQKRQYCESPVALFRRRALEKLNGNTSDSSSECSTDLEIQQPPGEKVPFEKLLDGVIAFVDVRRDNVDKSSGIKLVMESMGAIVKDKLCKGVTHVVFKDADFMTYHAARLLKCHLVSVLWLDAIRKKGYRVPEKNYPAFGGDDANASVLCSQIQKEFDDIIKEEKRRSYDVRKISSQQQQQQQQKQQRRTLITPMSSKSSYGTAKSTPKSSTNTDSEIVDILSNLPSTSFIQQSSPELTSDDSDCGVVNGYTSSHLKKKFKRLKTNNSIDTTDNSEQSQSLIINRKVRNTPAKIPVIEETKTIPTSHNNNSSSSNSKRITRSSSKSKTSNINVLSDVMLQTPSKISNNEESSDRTQTLSIEQSAGNVSSSLTNSRNLTKTNSRSSRRSCNFKDSNDMIVQKSSLIHDYELSDDRTKTISTAKSTNVSTLSSSDLNGNVDENDEIQSTMPSLRLSSSSKNSNKENSGLLSNLIIIDDKKPAKIDNNEINKIQESQENQPKIIMKKRRLFDPETIYCSPRNDELEREQRKRYLQIKDKCEQNNIDLNDNKLNTERKRKKKSTNSNKTDTSSTNESSSSPEKQPTSTFRRSQRLSITPQPTSYKCDKIIDNNNRRSSLEFQNSTEQRKKTRLRIDRTKTPSIVCTRFHRYETLEFMEVVKQLGVFQVELHVTKKTTHLIAGQSKRTINMLRALARGCWILKREWLNKSLEHGRWLPEEDYELTEFSAAVQQCRLERQAFGPHYTMDIFENCGKIFVSNSTIPGRDELRELIEICKGDLTNVYRNADIVVGQYVRSPNTVCVTEAWILDSITENKLKSVKRYEIKNSDSPHF